MDKFYKASKLIVAAALILLALIGTYNIGHERGKCERKSVINIRYENIANEVYPALENIGYNLTPEQKEAFNKYVRQQHRKV